MAKISRFNWLLFIDSDMMPVHNKYLLNYLSNIKSASVIFGGYRYKKDYRKTQLRKNYGISREEKSAKKRSQKPFKYVFSGLTFNISSFFKGPNKSSVSLWIKISLLSSTSIPTALHFCSN